MTGIICSIVTCKSNSVISKRTGEFVRFYSFPKTQSIRKEWIRRCYRKDKFRPENKRICSKHFLLTDYEDLIHAKITDTQPKKLKATAIPTLHLPFSSESKTSPRTQRLQKKEQRELVDKLLSSKIEVEPSNTTTKSQSLQIEEPCEMVSELLHSEIKIESPEYLEDANATIKNEDLPLTSQLSPFDQLHQKYVELQREHEALKIDLLNATSNANALLEKNKILENANKELKGDIKAKVRKMFEHFLTPNQLNVVLKRQQKARWTNDEVLKALALKYLNKRAYIYVRETLKYPLPGISTLQNLASKLDMKDVLNIVNICDKNKSVID